MKRSVCYSVVLCVVVMIAGCDSGREPTDAKVGMLKESGHVTISGMDYPVYPGATLLQDLRISVAYRVEAEQSDVRAWYDKQMAAEGWRSVADWVSFGGQYQKDFLSGKALRNPQFAEKMVKLGVGPHKKGGTHLMITPIVSKYGPKKQP